jgi:hypothetical protein
MAMENIMLEIKTIYYLAGLLEGEGTFFSDGSTPGIRIGMTDKDTISDIATLWGSNICISDSKQDYKKRMYITYIYGAKAVAWMMMLYSLMKSRRKAKIKEVMDRWKATKCHALLMPALRCNKGHLLTPENLYTSPDLGRIRCKVCKGQRTATIRLIA